MQEWGVFTVLIAVISGFFLVYSPLRSSAKEKEEVRLQQEKEAAEARNANTKAITELTTSLRIFTEHFNSVEKDNSESHRRIYDRLEEKGKTIARHDEMLKDHERRIKSIEEVKHDG